MSEDEALANDDIREKRVKFVDKDDDEDGHESSENDDDLYDGKDSDADSNGEDGGLFVNPLLVNKSSKKNGKST